MTNLAPIGVINLVRCVAEMMGVRMDLPFTAQFETDDSLWVNFPLVDQMEIVSRICTFTDACHDSRVVQFSVLGDDAMFEIRSSDRLVSFALSNIRKACMPSTDMRARLKGVDAAFFVGRGLQFVSGSLV